MIQDPLARVKGGCPEMVALFLCDSLVLWKLYELCTASLYLHIFRPDLSGRNKNKKVVVVGGVNRLSLKL